MSDPARPLLEGPFGYILGAALGAALGFSFAAVFIEVLFRTAIFVIAMGWTL